MNTSLTVVAPVVKKVAKATKRNRRPRNARQFEPSPIRDMDDFNQQERRQAEIAKQLEELGDVLFA